MSSGKNNRNRPKPPQRPAASRTVSSLLDAMSDGNEYGSIVSVSVAKDVVPDMRRALADIERIRQRPCIAYVANVVRGLQDVSISPQDHLPFCEMVNNVDTGEKAIDVFLVTPGGLAYQVSQFVNALRPRFDKVDFLLPYMCMSAGTLWAVSDSRRLLAWSHESSFMQKTHHFVQL